MTTKPYLLRFAEGKIYRTRNGSLVLLIKIREDGMTGQVRFGGTDRLLVEYSFDGKKRPLGGTDPLDII